MTEETVVKPCRTCAVEFAPSLSQIRQGTFICKPCKSALDRAHREKRKARGLSVSGKRMPPSYHKEYGEAYCSRPEVKARRAALAKGRRENPDERYKHEARWKTRRAINSGKLVKAPCEVCGSSRVDAHHDDYSKPLDVRWLCRPHHIEHHAKARNQELGV